jgi:hypothetical protein
MFVAGALASDIEGPELAHLSVPDLLPSKPRGEHEQLPAPPSRRRALSHTPGVARFTNECGSILSRNSDLLTTESHGHIEEMVLTPRK